jgi:hypothetical protein
MFESVDKLHEAVDVLPDKLTGRLLVAQPQYQPYLPFQQTPFHSIFLNLTSNQHLI